jgi:hypothetical protein
MRKRNLLCAALAALASVSAGAETRLATYEVTITNATRNQRFTPLLVATHGAGAQLFSVGAAASAELATLAEEGSTAPLANALQADPAVREVSSTSGLLAPGASVQVVIRGVPGERISLAAMLIPTNDAFVAVNGADLPKGRQVVTLNAVAYDAGSERNDESCASIPGPGFAECGGPGGGGAPSGGEEGFVHVHNGMHGVGDFDAAERDWRNPVALVAIRRIR